MSLWRPVPDYYGKGTFIVGRRCAGARRATLTAPLPEYHTQKKAGPVLVQAQQFLEVSFIFWLLCLQEELAAGEEIAHCPSCSLYITVIYNLVRHSFPQLHKQCCGLEML